MTKLGTVLCVCLLSSCSSNQESLGKTSSFGDSGVDGATDADSGFGGTGGGLVIEAGSGGVSNDCVEDTDCTNSEYSELVRSEADCYCPECSFQPLPVTVHDMRVAAWTKYCSEWFKTANCADIACSAFSFCQNGKCALPDPI